MPASFSHHHPGIFDWYRHHETALLRTENLRGVDLDACPDLTENADSLRYFMGVYDNTPEHHYKAEVLENVGVSTTLNLIATISPDSPLWPNSLCAWLDERSNTGEKMVVRGTPAALTAVELDLKLGKKVR